MTHLSVHDDGKSFFFFDFFYQLFVEQNGKFQRVALVRFKQVSNHVCLKQALLSILLCFCQALFSVLLLKRFSHFFFVSFFPTNSPFVLNHPPTHGMDEDRRRAYYATEQGSSPLTVAVQVCALPVRSKPFEAGLGFTVDLLIVFVL